jgi:hypothetical protein
VSLGDSKVQGVKIASVAVVGASTTVTADGLVVKVTRTNCANTSTETLTINNSYLLYSGVSGRTVASCTFFSTCSAASVMVADAAITAGQAVITVSLHNCTNNDDYGFIMTVYND